MTDELIWLRMEAQKISYLRNNHSQWDENDAETVQQKKNREKREDSGMSILWNFWGLLLSWRYTTSERSYSMGEVSTVRSGVHSV